jgi:hypothetical protein
MSSEHEVRHDKITAPERLTKGHVEALAMQKAQRKARRGRIVELKLGDGHPVGGGDQGPELEWAFTYKLVPPSA